MVAHICGINHWQKIVPVWIFQFLMLLIFVTEKCCQKNDIDSLEALNGAFKLLSLSGVVCGLTRLPGLPVRRGDADGGHPGHPDLPREGCEQEELRNLVELKQRGARWG